MFQWMFTSAFPLEEQVEESPYTWLLTDMGAPMYDEEWNVTGYAADVFWFDFEGFDISTDYINILNGMLALAEQFTQKTGLVLEKMD